jgi:phosphoglycerate dehydrogenase-like enzyme
VSERNILMTNAQSLLGPPVADHAMALLLTLTRGLAVYHDQQRNRQWSPQESQALPGSVRWELDGKTMVVIGLGGIGSEIARRGYGFGMHVKGTRNSRREAPEYVEYVGLANEAQELARTADVVVNAAPLTPATWAC